MRILLNVLVISLLCFACGGKAAESKPKQDPMVAALWKAYQMKRKFEKAKKDPKNQEKIQKLKKEFEKRFQKQIKALKNKIGELDYVTNVVIEKAKQYLGEESEIVVALEKRKKELEKIAKKAAKGKK